LLWTTERARPSALPLIIPSHLWTPLYQNADENLQRTLKTLLDKNPIWKSLIEKQKMAVGLVDLSRPTKPRFASLNGNTMLYAASLPKIAILLATFQAFEDGTLKERPEITADLHDMIRYSSNEAATRLIDLLGFEKIATTLTAPRYKLFDPRQGGLWVGKRYAKTGRHYPDPLQGLSHAATANQVCRFYHLLATGRLINPERSRQMLEIMDKPGLHHKFVHALLQQGTEAHVYRKSGTWKIWHADSMLVWGSRDQRYILVALVEDARGEQILRDLVPVVQKALRVAPLPLAQTPKSSRSI
jgi:beta-lactamase class A